MKERKKKKRGCQHARILLYSLSTATMKFILLTTGSVLIEPKLSTKSYSAVALLGNAKRI